MAHATVSRCLTRRGMSRAPRPAREQVRRFEWPCPGDLLQMDTKRLARFSRPGHTRHRRPLHAPRAEKRERVGWEFCHSIIDDHSRLVYTELHADERADDRHRRSSSARSEFFAGHGITPRRLQTDNAWTYIHNRGLRELLAERGIQHRRIPPRTPKRNGKVERYQQTLAREWAYGQRYRSSAAVKKWRVPVRLLRRTNSIAAPGRQPPRHPDGGRSSRPAGASAGPPATQHLVHRSRLYPGRGRASSRRCGSASRSGRAASPAPGTRRRTPLRFSDRL